MNQILNIALPIPKNCIFSYLPIPGTENENLTGHRVLVPFGNRTVTGVIVGNSPPDEKIKYKQIIEICDESPVFSKEMLDLTRWISEYYMASWGETLRAALPPGMSPQSVINIEISKIATDSEILEMAKRSPKRAALLELLQNHSGPCRVSTLERELKTENIRLQLDALETAGWVKCETQMEKSAKPVFRKALKITSELIENQMLLKTALDKLDAEAPKQSLLLSRIYLNETTHGEAPFQSDILREVKFGIASVDGLVKKGYIEVFKKEVNRASLEDAGSLGKGDESVLQLTEEQQTALEEIENALSNEQFKSFLLHGITGSGKTLVYIHAIKRCHSLGKTALLLVPEISLTPQLIDRFRIVFPGQIAVLHSKMSQGERYDAWRNIHKGNINIVIGARSALFAPLPNLGLIIVDEEHESSYKQESPSPRYSARDCALMRGRLENTVVVLGSATPSLESMYNAKSGKSNLLSIAHRADGAMLPKIRIIDIIEHYKKGRMKGQFSRDLLDAITYRIQRKEGIILFRNRRGFSSSLECTDCGSVPECKNCSVTLTFHKKARQLRCHYCGYTAPAFNVCQVCGSIELREIGSGTQRVEEELTEILAQTGIDAKIARMDSDTTSKRGVLRKILTDFASGETDILVGTQMVAKGLDFSRVTLVGVINADIQLLIPDFRSSERTFQMLTQVAGRAGRSGELQGEVIIQTAHSQEPAIIAVGSSDFELFYSQEIDARRKAMYPPFTRFIRIEFYGTDEKLVDEHINRFRKLLPKSSPALTILGPTAPAVARVRSQFRRILIIKNDKAKDATGKNLRAVLHSAIDKYQKEHATKKVRFVVDIDSFAGV
ncbi:MAG: priA [Ignavibacteria bacterium]|nr:priA [Ignavibacteria bacterium]